MGGTFAATEATVRNIREKDDALNGAAGGCAAGFLIGLRRTYAYSDPLLFEFKPCNREVLTSGVWRMRCARSGGRRIRLLWPTDRRPRNDEGGKTGQILQDSQTSFLGRLSRLV